MHRRKFLQIVSGGLIAGGLPWALPALAEEEADDEIRRLAEGVARLIPPGEERVPYLIVSGMPARGLIRCARCGESVNMGSFGLYNTVLGEGIAVDFLGLHTMLVHGLAKYHVNSPIEEDNGERTVDVDRLRRVLSPPKE